MLENRTDKSIINKDRENTCSDNVLENQVTEYIPYSEESFFYETDNAISTILTKEEQENVSNEIKQSWPKLETKEDLLQILNKALLIIYGANATAFTMKELNYHSYSTINPNRYFSFEIPKKNGSKRKIDAPCNGLKHIQRCLNVIFQIIHTPHNSAMGFVKGRSVVSGAMVHLQQKYVYNIDLKDFFPSVTSGRLYKRLQSKPFSCNENIASIITDLCCYQNEEGKNVLPQGAPTSPTITNFICERLDRKLSKLSSAYCLKYSRYADDITFSGMINVFDEEGKFCKSLKNIIENEEGFKINETKTRLCHKGERMEVTGLTVNEKVNVSRDYIKQLRTLIHNIEVKGYDEAQRIFATEYKETNLKNHDFIGEHYVENIIAGKLLYLKMVKGEKDSTYLKLKERFEIAMNGRISLKKERPKTQNIKVGNLNANTDDTDVLQALVNLMSILEN